MKFKEFIAYHGIAPLSYLAFRNFSLTLSEDLESLLKNTYYHSIVESEKSWQEFLRIHNAFESKNIAIVPLKGVAFLHDIYSQMPSRPMADIDILVMEEDIDQASQLLLELGYERNLEGLKKEYWRQDQYHFVFQRLNNARSILVELHWSLDYKRGGRNLYPELWQRLREINVDARQIKVMSAEDSLFVLALHNRRRGSPFNLKNTIDAVFLLEKYLANFDWDYILRISKKYSLCSTVYFALYQAQYLSSLDIPKDVWNNLIRPHWKRALIHYFIKKHTFFSGKESQVKYLFLKTHFLLYDSLWEPIEYILNIPKEQFAKFYELKPYDRKTDLFYRLRYAYIPFREVCNLLCH